MRVPMRTRMWNSLPQESHTIDYAIGHLKRKWNPLFYKGCRSNNVKHAQLRMKCSKLNTHLYSLHVSDTAQCLCGYHIEDTEHFLLHCPLYQISRQKMLQSIARPNININDIDDHVLLYGNDRYSLLTNKNIFSAVHTFISESDRL